MNESEELSKKELALIADRDFLLAKRKILVKIHHQLGRVEERLLPMVRRYRYPPGVLTRSGKISRGDSYQDLPYLVLDYPRAFEKQGIFAFRSMFWWGHHYSSTLHLGGEYLERYRDVLLQHLDDLCRSEDYFCVNKGPWHYHYQESNYQLLKELDRPLLRDALQHKPFVKISQRYPLEAFQQLPDLISQHFQQVMSWLDIPISAN